MGNKFIHITVTVVMKLPLLLQWCPLIINGVLEDAKFWSWHLKWQLETIQQVA